MYATRIGLKSGLLRRLLRTAIATGGRPPSKRECTDDETRRLISVLALRKLQKCAGPREPEVEAPPSTDDPALSEPSSSGWAT